ncbi:glycosyl hydrolase family 28-related protein [Merismopedia glauca]|uniref:Rhamnogalacturonase A/B/Epimerase-like pectate lyase domain-containing protein n=1 Tax=Merismopedia glauca CCAP 1448/3 TaxID=1296344 RepID=A0A2T1C0E5_9CYAN|nr:glycosyl hydrolase family 28-related protein [Merismopedia glauca]PSB01712.1 hypothetical protein C7B64_16905 [Merismopedia glauca CCAP 1448/3]
MSSAFFLNVKDYGAIGNGTANDNAAIDKAVAECKRTGKVLFFPAGRYNCNLTVIRAALTHDASHSIYERSFHILGEKAAILGEVQLLNCRNVFVHGLIVEKNFEISGCQHSQIAECSVAKAIILSEYFDKESSDHDPDWLGTYWCKIDKCTAGSSIVFSQHTGINANTYVSTFLGGAKRGSPQGSTGTNDKYDNHNASLYINAIQCETTVLIGCDTSYSDYPLWKTGSNDPVCLIGHYYEGNTNNFFTDDGNRASPTVATIINGFDYDRTKLLGHVGFSAARFRLIANTGGTGGLAEILVPTYGGSLLFKDQASGNPFAEMVNRLSPAPENRAELNLYQTWGEVGFVARSDGLLRLKPRSTPPDSPQEGDIYMDSGDHRLKVFDGSQWRACW